MSILQLDPKQVLIWAPISEAKVCGTLSTLRTIISHSVRSPNLKKSFDGEILQTLVLVGKFCKLVEIDDNRSGRLSFRLFVPPDEGHQASFAFSVNGLRPSECFQSRRWRGV